MLRYGLALLEMPDCEKLQMVSNNCNTVEADHNRGQVNEMSKNIGKNKQNLKY